MRTFVVVIILLYSLLFFGPNQTSELEEYILTEKFTFNAHEQRDELPSPNMSDWLLVWADEFNFPTLDTTKWTAEHAALEKNEELQFYARDHVYVQDGHLILQSSNQPLGGRPYTSGAVHTKNKIHLLYGKVEMRAKLPAGQGIFPAFWAMTVAEDTWLPEIDIVEMLGHKPNELWFVYHRLNAQGRLESLSDVYIGEDFSKQFHRFGLEWTPERITWYVDDKPRFQITTNIPHEPMFLYINTAIGGVWPGSPDITTHFPVHFVIDYVRIYKKAEVVK